MDTKVKECTCSECYEHALLLKRIEQLEAEEYARYIKADEEQRLKRLEIEKQASIDPFTSRFHFFKEE